MVQVGSERLRNNCLENQKKAIHEIFDSLKSGGELWFAENLAASPLHRFLRKHFVHWGDYWRYPDLPELQGLLGIFPRVEMVSQGFFGAFGRNPVVNPVLGLIDKAINRLVPETWRYIAIGVAKKR